MTRQHFAEWSRSTMRVSFHVIILFFFKSSSTKNFIIIFPDNTIEANNSTINPLQWRATNKQQKYTIHGFILEVLMAGQYKLGCQDDDGTVRRVSAWCVRCPAEAPCQTNLSF